MLDKRTAVAENDDLMRSAANLLIVWRNAYVFGGLTEKIAANTFINEIDDLAYALESADSNWEAHYGK